jgi:8-oxo-dGTP pyrophosphatase MutT (NUDIX family)
VAPVCLDIPPCLGDVWNFMFKVSIKGVPVGPDGRVILLQNERNEWELPGGQIELGESPPQCLAREIQEELGLQVEVEHPLDTYLFEVLLVTTSSSRRINVHWWGPSIRRSAWSTSASDSSRDRLPRNLPAGYRGSIASAMGGTNRSLTHRPMATVDRD